MNEQRYWKPENCYFQVQRQKWPILHILHICTPVIWLIENLILSKCELVHIICATLEVMWRYCVRYDHTEAQRSTLVIRHWRVPKSFCRWNREKQWAYSPTTSFINDFGGEKLENQNPKNILFICERGAITDLVSCDTQLVSWPPKWPTNWRYPQYRFWLNWN